MRTIRLDYWIGAAFLAGITGAVLLLLMGHHPNDDAYITFRHSRFFAEHFRLAWNPAGKAELGTTSPLFAVLLGVFGFLFGSSSIPQISLHLNAFLLALCGPLFFLIALELTRNKLVSLAIAFLLCINSFNIRIYSQGFELALFCFLFFLGLYLLLGKNLRSAAFIAGILPLVRPEGVWLSVPLFCVLVFRHKFLTREGFRPGVLLAYGAVPLAWLIFSLLFYEQILPQSVAAKRDMNLIEPPFGSDGSMGGRLWSTALYLFGFWNVLLKPILLQNGEAAVLYLPNLPYKPGNFFLRRGETVLWWSLLFYAVLFYRFHRSGEKTLLWHLSYPLFFTLFLMYTMRIELWYVPPWNSSVLLLLGAGSYHFFLQVQELLAKLKTFQKPTWEKVFR